MPQQGTFQWADLTIDNADEVRDFYSAVVGWTSMEISMGEYADYAMLSPDGEGQVGICHARGENAGQPPQWIIYVNVENLDVAIGAAESNGGKLMAGPRGIEGDTRFAVIQDPAGAFLGVMENAPDAPTAPDEG